MTLTIQKWGNSLALRIPRAVAKDVRLSQGSMLNMAVSKNRIILEIKGQKQYSLSGLLRKITRHNLHSEVDMGRAVGHEIW